MIPAGEVLEKVDYNESEIEEGGSTEIPSITIGGKNTINPIAQILQKHKKSTHTPLEILAKSCNVSINKKHGYLLDNTTGNVIKPSQLFAYKGLSTAGNVRCPLPDCLKPMSYDLILWHFEDHKLSLEKVSKLFEREFHLWDQYDGGFRYLGEPIAA